MDGNVVEFSIQCISEKTGDFVGGGIELDSNWTKEDIDLGSLFECMGESFWELLCEFEGSVQTAIDNGEVTSVDRENLYKVFGHFYFVVKVDNKEIEFDVGVDPDEYMYSNLIEYVDVDTP